MLRKEYRRANVGDLVQIIGHTRDLGKIATIVNKPCNQKFNDGGPLQIKFFGEEKETRWLTHRVLKYLEGRHELGFKEFYLKKQLGDVLWSVFLKFMQGQTITIIDGVKIFYYLDVQNFCSRYGIKDIFEGSINGRNY